MAWIDSLFERMRDMGAADLHITSEHTPMVRDSGDLIPMPGAPSLSATQVDKVLSEIIPERNKEQYAETNDTDFAYALDGVGRFRANIFRDRYGMGAVFRLIPEKILSADQLGLLPL